MKGFVSQARWLTSSVRQWLQTTVVARVLHVFPRVCNLINAAGEVLSLTATELGRGPFALVLSLPEGWDFTGVVTANTAVSCSPPMLRIGALQIDVSEAAAWSPRPAWHTLQAMDWSLWALRWQQQAAAKRRESGTTSTMALAALDGATAQLAGGLKRGNTAVCIAAARQLAGLGGGLTPAGDDVLVGAIYGLWAMHPEAVAQPWGMMLAEAAVPRTTSLSAAWLQAAARGEAGEPWHDLVAGLALDDETAVEAALARILATGHTSGADALLGVTAVVGHNRIFSV